MSLQVSPEGCAPGHHGNSINGIDNINNSDGNKCSCDSRSKTGASRTRKRLPVTPQADKETDSAGTTSFQHQPGQRERLVPPQLDARDTGTSILDTFRARLDRRLEGISIPRASQKRDTCDGEELENGARLGDGTDKRQEEPSAGSATDTETAAKNTLWLASKSASPVAAKAGTHKIGHTLLSESHRAADARVHACEESPVDGADSAPAEKGVARGSTNSQCLNTLTQKAADEHRGMRVWEWEHVRVDWNPKNALSAPQEKVTQTRSRIANHESRVGEADTLFGCPIAS